MFLSSCSSIEQNKLDSNFEQDRNAILSLAGNFRVNFKFEETISFKKEYKIKEPYKTSANEVIKIIEDRGDFISLQHVLVATFKEKHFAIKHWRQDWQFQPNKVLVFIGGNAWKKKNITKRNSYGSWSQTVYQVDDSPRYGAVGKWNHYGKVSEWNPKPEWRPLPRRDMTKRDDYHTINAVNRHVITPFGWVHEEHNSKIILKNQSQILAREIGINTYERFNDFEIGIAEQYLMQTNSFWREVRTIWTKLENHNGGFKLTLKGEPEELYMALLEIAGNYMDKNLSLDDALLNAKKIITKHTSKDIGKLNSRLR